MHKITKLNLTLIIFLSIVILSIAYIIKNSNQSQTIMPEGSSTNLNQANIPQIPDNREKEVVKKDFDWSPFIEKYYGKEISKINTDKKIATLTFDGGSNADGAEKILEILNNNGLKATFFLTGKFIEKYPETVKKIIGDGHEIGNHSYSHPYFTKLSEAEMKEELDENAILLEKLGGKQEPFLRLPYGDRNSAVLNFVSQNAYINIRWTVDSLGWQGSAGSMNKEKVQERVVSKTTPGSIIMMHLGSDTNKTNLDSEALQNIIVELKNADYKFLPLSELLKGER